jgi:hypothetical protein
MAYGRNTPIFPVVVKCFTVSEALEVAAIQPILNDIGYNHTDQYIAQALFDSQLVRRTLNDGLPFYPICGGVKQRVILRDYQ